MKWTRPLALWVNTQLAVLVITLLASGCITDRKLERAYEKSARYRNYPSQIQIDGQYRDSDKDSPVQCGKLLERLVESYPRAEWEGNEELSVYKAMTTEAQQIELHFNGKTTLTVKVWDSSRKVPVFRLRVKDKGKYLSVRHHSFLLPIPGLIMYSRYKLILLNSPENDLVAVSGRGSFVEAYFFFPIWKTLYNIEVFDRMN
jgi:hypothetical protein